MICPHCQRSYGEGERYCGDDAQPLVEEQDLARVGTTVGNYNLVQIVGRGGMGTVYRAEHVYIGKLFAVKILRPLYAEHGDAVTRFLAEARAASSIAHPNIVDVTDFGPMPDGGVFFVMEYLDGKSLATLIEESAPLELLRAINIVNQIASALGAAHAKQIVHRDLKPENIMLIERPGRRELVRTLEGGAFTVEPEGAFDFVKVLDFGIAKVLETADLDAASGAVFGTPDYMSPEAAQLRPTDHRADIYSLGILFYEMLTGQVPFEADRLEELLAKQIREPPRPPTLVCPEAEIPPAAERLIMRSLAKDPAGRQQSMDELRDELQGCYGSVVYRRDASRFPAVRAAGIQPRRKRLTEELGELLGATEGVQKRKLEAVVEGLAAGEVPVGPVIETGGDDAPLLLTHKKKP